MAQSAGHRGQAREPGGQCERSGLKPVAWTQEGSRARCGDAGSERLPGGMSTRQLRACLDAGGEVWAEDRDLRAIARPRF